MRQATRLKGKPLSAIHPLRVNAGTVAISSAMYMTMTFGTLTKHYPHGKSHDQFCDIPHPRHIP